MVSSSLTLTGELAEQLIQQALARQTTPEALLKSLLEKSDIQQQGEFLAAAEGRPDAFYILTSRRDGNGEITDFDFSYLNHAAEQQLGMKREALLGRGICEVFPIHLKDGRFDYYKRVVTTRDPFEEDYSIPDELPGAGWWHHYVSPLDGTDGISIVNTNIDERKQMEQELHLAKERFEKISSNLPLGAIYQIVLGQDQSRQFTYMSSSIERVTGLSAEAIMADASIVAPLIHPDDRDKLQTAEAESRAKLTHFNYEFRIINAKTGRRHWLNARSMPRQLPNGDIIFDGLLIDITAYKNLEKMIQRNKRMLKQTEAIAHVGGFTEDLRTGEIIWTEEAYRINEVPLGTIITPKIISDLYTADDQKRIADAIEQVVFFRETASLDVHAITLQGTSKWLHIMAQPWVEDDEVIAIQGIVQDITQRKIYEETLLQSYELLDTLGNNLPSGAIYQVTYSTNGEIFFNYMSPSIEKILGVTAEAVMEDAHTLLDLTVPEDAPLLQKHRDISFQQRVNLDLEFRQRALNDGVKWMHYRSKPRYLSNGDTIFDGIIVDITTQKELEVELRRRQETLKQTQQMARVGGWEVDFRSESIQWSEETYAIFEVPLETHINSDFMYSLYTPFYRSQIRHIRRKAREFRQPTDIEAQITTTTGRQKWLRMVSNPIFEEDEVVGLIGMIQDITEQKTTQEQTVKLQLEQRRVQILSDFVQNIGHEFRTPLTIINSSLNLLLRNPTDEANREKHAGRIEAQAANILTLVEDLTTLVRLDSGGYNNFGRISLPEFVETLFFDLRDKCEPDHDWAVHTNYESHVLIGNEEILMQAFQQVILNAIQHTSTGGKITLDIKQIHDDLEFCVCDAGVGMSEEIMSHAFERFYRGNQAHTTRGFGLGLAIAQKAVELHNGRITLESEVEKGTKVTICLPLDPLGA